MKYGASVSITPRKPAYASNPVGQVIIDTLEFRYPSFIDDNGNPAAFRVVNQYQDVFAALEASAPLQAGQTVQFMGFAFGVTLPGFEEGQTPALKITIDNIGRELMTQLGAATTSQQPIEVTYRPYSAFGPNQAADGSAYHHDGAQPDGGRVQDRIRLQPG